MTDAPLLSSKPDQCPVMWPVRRIPDQLALVYRCDHCGRERIVSAHIARTRTPQ